MEVKEKCTLEDVIEQSENNKVYKQRTIDGSPFEKPLKPKKKHKKKKYKDVIQVTRTMGNIAEIMRATNQGEQTKEKKHFCSKGKGTKYAQNATKEEKWWNVIPVPNSCTYTCHLT